LGLPVENDARLSERVLSLESLAHWPEASWQTFADLDAEPSGNTSGRATTSALHSHYSEDPRRLQPAFQLAFARLVTHYFHHNAWLEEGVLLRHASALAHIRGILVHGRLDLGSPLITAWELAQAWPNSELVMVNGAGHASTDPGMSEAIIAALDRFATRH
jgi:pimeloyl-ACP methyl ester carboxylesterase